MGQGVWTCNKAARSAVDFYLCIDLAVALDDLTFQAKMSQMVFDQSIDRQDISR